MCVRPGDFSQGGVPTSVGISTHELQTRNWPENVPNGFIALESAQKGMVISRVENESAIADPIPGMLIYDKSANCVKLYRVINSLTNQMGWSCIKRNCNKK